MLVGDLALVLVSAIVMVLQGIVLAYRVLPRRRAAPAELPVATTTEVELAA